MDDLGVPPETCLHDLGNCPIFFFARSTATSPTSPKPEVSAPEGEGYILPPCFMNSVSCHQISYDDVFVFRHVGQQSGFFNMATFDQKRLRAGAAQCSFSTNSGPASAQKKRGRDS